MNSGSDETNIQEKEMEILAEWNFSISCDTQYDVADWPANWGYRRGAVEGKMNYLAILHSQ
jgi:hypothetical protein